VKPKEQSPKSDYYYSLAVSMYWLQLFAYATIAVRSLKIGAALFITDVVVAFLPFSKMIDMSPIGVIGDLLLVEVAALFIIAGVLDFSSSIGMTQFRRVFLSSKEEYSPDKRRQTERTAMVYLFAGLILLSAMVLLMIYDNAV
jgi:hypothetical protein